MKVGDLPISTSYISLHYLYLYTQLFIRLGFSSINCPQSLIQQSRSTAGIISTIIWVQLWYIGLLWCFFAFIWMFRHPKNTKPLFVLTSIWYSCKVLRISIPVQKWSLNKFVNLVNLCDAEKNKNINQHCIPSRHKYRLIYIFLFLSRPTSNIFSSHVFFAAT